MTDRKSKNNWEIERELQYRIKPMVGRAPWVLRITEHKDKPAPVLVVKRRFQIDEAGSQQTQDKPKQVLREWGTIYGQSMRRCLPIIRRLVEGVCDSAGVPLELQRFFADNKVLYRGNLPLDDEAGNKLSLIFRLQERVKDANRVELIAWRVERFTYEEAAYWLSRITQYGEAANRWAQAGMRTMLGGHSEDEAVMKMLEEMRR